MNEQIVLRVVKLGLSAVGVFAPAAAAELAIRLFSRPRRFPRPEREREILRTAGRLEVAGGLSAYRWGTTGPTVLLVHGWEGRGTQLGAFIEPLLAAGRQVVALDAPAHGDSPGKATHVLEYAAALRAVAGHIADLEGVVAHSFGVAAVAIALDEGLPARRVVLIAGPASVRDVIERFISLVGLRPPVAESFNARIVARVGRTPEELEIATIGPRMRAPALVFHDPEDAEVPYSDALKIAERWPDARLRTVYGEGHRRILRSAEVVEEAVAFLTSAGRDAFAPAARSAHPLPNPSSR